MIILLFFSTRIMNYSLISPNKKRNCFKLFIKKSQQDNIINLLLCISSGLIHGIRIGHELLLV